MMDALEEKICCMEEGLRNDIEDLTNKSVKSHEEMQSCNAKFEIIEAKIKEAKDDVKSLNQDMNEQNRLLENLSKENAKNISEAKNDNDINNKCIVINMKGMEESFNDLKTELETLQKTQIIEVSKDIGNTYTLMHFSFHRKVSQRGWKKNSEKAGCL